MTLEQLNRRYHNDHPCIAHSCLGRWGIENLPALHTDANLLITELDRINDGVWLLSRDTTGFHIQIRNLPPEVITTGATFNEAGLKALVAALEAKQDHWCPQCEYNAGR